MTVKRPSTLHEAAQEDEDANKYVGKILNFIVANKSGAGTREIHDAALADMNKRWVETLVICKSYETIHPDLLNESSKIG